MLWCEPINHTFSHGVYYSRTVHTDPSDPHGLPVTFSFAGGGGGGGGAAVTVADGAG